MFRSRIQAWTGNPAPDVTRAFLRWTGLRASLHRGYVLASGLYFATGLRLSAAQLVALGTVVGLTLLIADVPGGVWSDAVSRKRALVIGHGFLAAGMVLTGLVGSFPLVVLTQVLWGLGWAFSGGADVAWLNDELDRPDRIARALAARARWDLVGGAAGTVAFGLLGWAAGLGVAIVVTGMAMAALGLAVAIRFPEDRHRAVARSSGSVLRRGVRLARGNPEVRRMLAATMLLNGAGVVTWLFPRRLVDAGFPGETVLWYTALGILSFATGAVALRLVEARIDGAGVARRSYLLACLVGGLGLALLAIAPSAVVGGLGVLLASGIGFTVTRAVSVIWVNERTTSDVRATVHSFLSQAESFGEVVGGIALALLARAAGSPATVLTSAVLVAATALLIRRPS